MWLPTLIFVAGSLLLTFVKIIEIGSAFPLESSGFAADRAGMVGDAAILLIRRG